MRPYNAYKFTYEMRKTLQSMLEEGKRQIEISRILDLNPVSIRKERAKGTVDGRYCAEYAEKVTQERRLIGSKRIPFPDYKKEMILSMVKRGNSMTTMVQRSQSSPRKVFLFLKEQGLESGYEEWANYSQGDARKAWKVLGQQPGSPREDRLQRQINLIKEQIDSMNMRLEILSERLKQRSST